MHLVTVTAFHRSISFRTFLPSRQVGQSLSRVRNVRLLDFVVDRLSKNMLLVIVIGRARSDVALYRPGSGFTSYLRSNDKRCRISGCHARVIVSSVSFSIFIYRLRSETIRPGVFAEGKSRITGREGVGGQDQMGRNVARGGVRSCGRQMPQLPSFLVHNRCLFAFPLYSRFQKSNISPRACSLDILRILVE